MNRKLFYTILSVIIVAATMVLFIACSGNQPDGPDQSEQTDQPNQTEEISRTEETSQTEQASQTEETSRTEETGQAEETSQTEQSSQGQEEKIFRISFVSNGGGVVEAIEKKAGEEISEPAVPVKEGFVFDGWYESSDNGSTLSDKPFIFAYMPARNCTLYAKWSEQIVKYTITFESNGGSSVNAIEKKAGEKIEEPAIPTKDGYIFDGWYESPDNGATLAEKPFVFAYMPARSVKLYAKWALQSVAGKVYKQSDTRFNWKNDAEKALFAANSTSSEDEAIEFYKKYKFEFTFVNDEKVTVSFYNMGTKTYHLYYEITADNTIKFYENAEAKAAGRLYRDVPILNNPFKVSNDRSSVIGIFELGVDLPGGSSMIVELDMICTVNGN